MKSTRVSPILFLGFAIIFLLSVTVYPVMAADTAKTQLDTFNITDIPTQPGGAGENNPVNVTVSNTTDVMDPEDRTKVPGTGTEPSTSVAPEVTGTSATTQPVTETTTNVSVTGTESSPSVAPEVPVTSTQVSVTEATPNARVTETPDVSLVNEVFETSIAESEPGYYSPTERAMRSEKSMVSAVSPTSQDITPLWSSLEGNFSSAPAIADGIAYISSNENGSTFALNLHTGKEIWSHDGGTAYDRGGPAVDNGMVFVGNLDNNVYALKAADGTPKWQFSTGSSVATRPFVLNGRVYFSNGTKIYTLDENTGQEQWRTGICYPYCSAIQGANGAIYFTDNETIYARNAINGDEHWVIKTYAPTFQAHTTSPVLVNGLLYCGSGHNLYVYNVITQKKIWTYNTKGEIWYPPTVANGVVYVGSDPYDFHAVNAKTGKKIWKITTKFASYSSLAVADGAVYFGNGHDLWAVNAADGRKLWQYNFGNAWVGSPAIADGILVVGTDPGPVYAFDLSRIVFTGTPRSGNAPLTVRFTDITAGNPTSWHWWFGDGAISTEQNPTHVYTAPGNYTVSLVADGPAGSHNTVRDDYITVAEAATPNVVVFGNTQAITTWPSGTDYKTVEGASAIRRNGSVDTFIGDIALKGNDWVMITNGAAIKKDGSLVRWGSAPSVKVPTPGASSLISVNELGKKYVAVSQHSDWLLAIYEDPAGLSHLETLANPAAPPASVSGNVPTGTGWKKIAAGNNHALALKSDGTLVAWGENSYGQRNLPTNTTYHDIDAGEDFSIGLDPASQILTAGRDDAGQVSGKPAGTGYMTIEAGMATGAALTNNGTIVQWGRMMSGIQTPSDAGYTDLSLGPDYGFALRESVKEAAVT